MKLTRALSRQRGPKGLFQNPLRWPEAERGGARQGCLAAIVFSLTWTPTYTSEATTAKALVISAALAHSDSFTVHS